MKQRLLVAIAFTVLVAAGWAVWVAACDQNKQTSAQASACSKHTATTAVASADHAGCTAEMAANCTAEMAAQCNAKGAKGARASMASDCPMHGTAATAADCCAKGAKASKASKASECPMHGATAAAAGQCDAHSMNATTASAGGECSAHSMKATAASAGGKGAAAASACKYHDAAKVMGDCFGSGMTTAMDASAHGDCDACADMAACAQQLTSNATQTQVLPLKNGVMFVYTTDTAARVRAVQSAIARRSQRIMALASSGDRARLCPDCKTMRGAIASGKLTRETVNIEGGCLTLMTSSDPAMVAKLRGMVGAQNGARTKI